MAAGSLLALLDDIASVLDDVALMSKTAVKGSAATFDDVAVLGKTAMKKTSGVLGDDLALNAQQVTGVNPDRELPVVWAVAKGSLLNKVILVPAALLISYFVPWLILPLLMLGGAFLSFEGAEKVIHTFFHKDKDKEKQARQAVPIDEKTKISGAVRTDFILSAEIIVISLGVVSSEPIMTQVIILSVIALLITVFVYGLVAGIVKLDDLGLYLSGLQSSIAKKMGQGILWLAPYLMKLLSIVGTIAMFLVGGSIILHGIPGAEHWLESVLPGHGAGMLGAILTLLVHFVIGLIVGLMIVAVVSLFHKKEHVA
jgi:predicted DNA repair protein MutK